MPDYTVDHRHDGMIDVQSDVTHHVDPITTDNRSAITMETPSPLETRSDITSGVTLDVKPVVTDACVRVEFGPLPPMQVCQPYTSRLAFSVMGFEILAWETSGQSQVVVPDRRPHVALPAGGAATAPIPSVRKGQRRRGGEGGLRVRIGG